MNSQQKPDGEVHGAMPFAEFVVLMALVMALTALAIDIMLPALPNIGESFGVTEHNHRQYVIIVYMFGFSLGQPVYGPLSDRFGRRPLLFVSLAVFAVATVWAALSGSFEAMLAARALQGFGAAGPRVLAMAIVRDRYAGREMSRVMSFIMTVFIVVPIVAPSIGEAIVQLGHWRWIFACLLATALAISVWIALRLAETHRPEPGARLTASALWSAFAAILGNRQTLGYTLAIGFIFGGLMTYIASAQQIFVDIYDLGSAFPLVFGAIASVIVLAAVTNGKLVRRVGMRRISHVALLGWLGACALFALAGFPARPPLLVFCAFAATIFYCFGLIMPNFNALAMEPLGRIAGMTSSFVGFLTTGIGATLGALVGQAFDGTLRPIVIGFTLLGGGALACVLVTERGRLFAVGADQAV
ncbi:MAG: multidrug effflux MFS transporter [Kiloniellales bacterium]